MQISCIAIELLSTQAQAKIALAPVLLRHKCSNSDPGSYEVVLHIGSPYESHLEEFFISLALPSRTVKRTPVPRSLFLLLLGNMQLLFVPVAVGYDAAHVFSQKALRIFFQQLVSRRFHGFGPYGINAASKIVRV